MDGRHKITDRADSSNLNHHNATQCLADWDFDGMDSVAQMH